MTKKLECTCFQVLNIILKIVSASVEYLLLCGALMLKVKEEEGHKCNIHNPPFVFRYCEW